MKAEDIIKHSIERHTIFQLNFFVLGKEPTHQAKLKKCVDEIKVRKKAIDSIMLEIEEYQDKNELLEMQEVKVITERRMLDRRILNNHRQIDSLLESMRNQKDEMEFFVESFNELSKKEVIKDWDSTEVQLEYWNAKLTEDINTKLSVGLPIDTETIKTILALPNEIPIKNQLKSLISKRIDHGR